MAKTAILVDGGFYQKRARKLWGIKSAKERADELINYCYRHLHSKHQEQDLYRIFYYDCPPINKRIYHPFLQKDVDFSKTDMFLWMETFLEHLKRKRKVALRLGKLAEEQAHFDLKPPVLRNLCRGNIGVDDLEEEDFCIDIDQKGVDMKIGIDISSLAYKKQVEQIVLIAGDSDFVPAAKLARREGIDFVLDAMWSTIKPELFEHIDGLRTCTSRPDRMTPQGPAMIINKTHTEE